MAKFLKSIFQPTEKRKCPLYEGDDDEDKSEAIGDRRKLSISRSGRLRQANKKRHSLTLALYGENIETVEKPKSIEYHVHSPVTPSEPVLDKRQRRRSADEKASEDIDTISSDSDSVNATARNSDDNEKRISAESKSPEEEIDSAFEIIDKS